jgi:Leucine Rich repeat
VDDSEEWREELENTLRDGLEDLYLFDLSVGAAEMAEVAKRLRERKTAVKSLHLSKNSIGDAGAHSVAELLRENGGGDGSDGRTAVEEVNLQENGIGRDGIEAVANALRHNSTVRRLFLQGNPGVDPEQGEAEAAAGTEALVAAIGVNTTLERVVGGSMCESDVDCFNAALKDTEGRRRGRELFQNGPSTKAARG